MTQPYNFDRVAEIYDATRGFTPEVEGQIARGLASTLRESTVDPMVLEVGVGTGRIAAPLAELGLRVVGTDISRAMLARLRSKCRDIHVVLADASRPPFRAASFDAALYVHVLHLLPEPDRSLEATLGVLRPGGMILACHHEYEPSVISHAGELIQQTIADVTGITTRIQGRHANLMKRFSAWVQAHGGTVERREFAHWAERASAASLLSELRNKTRSYTWSIPDPAIPGLVEVLTPRVAALFGGIDVVIEARASFVCAVGRFPV